MRRIGVLLFEDVEELDFAGPFEVFGVTSRLHPDTIELFTVAEESGEVRARHGLRVIPDYDFRSAPKPDILIVPGGRGAITQMKQAATLAYVREAAKSGELVASVCTGALILAAAGLLDGKRATTHWADLDELREFPRISVVDDQRYVHEGNIMTSAGISAGIDMSLHIVELFYGAQISREVAHRMDYRMLETAAQ